MMNTNWDQDDIDALEAIIGCMEVEEPMNDPQTTYGTTGVSTSMCDLSGHVWIYAGDPRYFPYEGMPCSCGTAKWKTVKCPTCGSETEVGQFKAPDSVLRRLDD